MSLIGKFTELANACRKRFETTSQLSIDDMIKLITPPPTIILIPKGQLYFTVSARDGVPQGGWGIIPSSEINNASKYLNMAKNGAIVRLHLYIKDNQHGNAEVKWDLNNNSTSGFQVKHGMCVVDFPPADYTPQFQLAVHAISCGISADLSQSYLELIPKKIIKERKQKTSL